MGFASCLITETGKVKNKLIGCLPSPPPNAVFFGNPISISLWQELGMWFFFSSILSQVVLEILPVGHPICTSYINSLCHHNRLRTDSPEFQSSCKAVWGVSSTITCPNLCGQSFFTVGYSFHSKCYIDGDELPIHISTFPNTLSPLISLNESWLIMQAKHGWDALWHNHEELLELIMVFSFEKSHLQFFQECVVWRSCCHVPWLAHLTSGR